MVEKIGGAVYEIDVSLDKAKGSLRRFEGEVAASGRRADSNLATGFRGGQGIVVNMDKATASTKRLTAAQSGLASGMRSSATAVASSIPVMGQFGSVAGGLASALPGLAVGVLAGAAAFSIFDDVLKRMSGAGLLDHVFGRADDIDRANRALNVRKGLEEDISRLRREGLSAEAAASAQLTDELRKADQARSKLTSELRAINIRALGEFLQPDSADSQSILFPGLGASTRQADAISGANSKAKKSFEDVATAIKALELTHRDLLVITQKYPELAGPLADELREQAEAAGLAQATLDKYTISVEAALAKQDLFTQSVSALEDIGSHFIDEQLVALEREQVALEVLKTKMGDAFGEAQQARLVEVGRLLDLLRGKQDLVSLSIADFAAQVQQAYGDLAPAAIMTVADALIGLPEEQIIGIKILLPDLFPIAAAFQNFIASLQAGANVVIAIRAASVGGFGTSPVANQSFLGGSISGLPGFNPLDFPSDAALDFEQKLADSLTNLNENAVGPLGEIADKTKEKVAAAAKMTQIWADGIIDLGEALDEGLNPAQAAQLELIHDAELAVYRLRDAEFRLEVERLKAASGADELRIALVEIAAELLRTGQTAEEFDLENRIRPALEGIASMINEVFGKPTRESLQLELQLKQLEKQRLLIQRRGGDTDQIDDRIDALRREIDLRETEFEIMRLQTELRDQQLQTDKELIDANAFLGAALEGVSGEADKVADALGIRLFDSAMRASHALDIVGASGGTGFTAAEKHWINGVARGRGEPEPFPGFQRGLPRVPFEMPVIVHPNEAILTAQQADDWRMGGGLSAQISIYGATDADMVANKVMRRLEDAQRIRGYGGASSLPHANTPRG